MIDVDSSLIDVDRVIIYQQLTDVIFPCVDTVIRIQACIKQFGTIKKIEMGCHICIHYNPLDNCYQLKHRKTLILYIYIIIITNPHKYLLLPLYEQLLS